MKSISEQFSQARLALGLISFEKGHEDLLPKDLAQKVQRLSLVPELVLKGLLRDTEAILLLATSPRTGRGSVPKTESPLYVVSCFREIAPPLPQFHLEAKVYWWAGLLGAKGIRTDEEVSCSYMVEPSGTTEVRRLFQAPIMTFLKREKGWHVLNDDCWFITYKYWTEEFNSSRICQFVHDSYQLLQLFQESEKAGG